MIKHIHAAIRRRAQSRECAAKAERVRLSVSVLFASFMSSIAIHLQARSTRVLRQANKARARCGKPLLYRCDQCGKVGVWSKEWRWYGPGANVTDGGSQSLTTIVCDECDAKHEIRHHEEPRDYEF